MKQILIIMLMIICSDIYCQEPVSTRKNELPSWIINNDTNLNWIIAKKLTDIEEKKNIIKSMQVSKGIFYTLDSIYNYPIDSIIKKSFLVDINHDNKRDFILYGFLPFCNFQPYIIIAINKDNAFQPIYSHEGDFISWHFAADTTAFQLFIHGCCNDRNGYVYNFACIKGYESDFYKQFSQIYDTAVHSVDNLNIFWIYNSEHPSEIRPIVKIEIQKDSTILLPFADKSKNIQKNIKEQFNWVFYKGDTGEILNKKVIKHETWYYIEMPIKQWNSPMLVKQGCSIYGWIRKVDFKRKM